MTWYVYWSTPLRPGNSAAADNKEGVPVSAPVIAAAVAGGSIALIVVISLSDTVVSTQTPKRYVLLV